MNNAILIIKDIYHEEHRISLNDVSSYSSNASFVTIILKSKEDPFHAMCTIEELDDILINHFSVYVKRLNSKSS